MLIRKKILIAGLILSMSVAIHSAQDLISVYIPRDSLIGRHYALKRFDKHCVELNNAFTELIVEKPWYLNWVSYINLCCCDALNREAREIAAAFESINGPVKRILADQSENLQKQETFRILLIALELRKNL